MFMCSKHEVVRQHRPALLTAFLTLMTHTRRYPDCNCNEDTKYSPYRTEILNRSKTASGNMYCFNLYTVPCKFSNPCCTTELYKVSLPIRKYFLYKGQRKNKGLGIWARNLWVHYRHRCQYLFRFGDVSFLPILLR